MKEQNIKFTVFKSNKENTSSAIRTIDLNTLVTTLKDNKDATQVAQFRSYVKYQGNPKGYNAYNQMPRLCASTEYYKNKAGERVFRAYNGVVMVEIADLTSPLEVEKAKSQAAMMPQTLCAFMGADGRSVIVLTLATLPDGTLPLTEETAALFHTQAYMTAVRCLTPQTEFKVSIKQPSLDTTCLMSTDEKPYVNPYPTPFIIQQPTPLTLKATVDKLCDDSMSSPSPTADALFTCIKVFNAAFGKAIVELQWNDDCPPEALWAKVADTCCAARLPEEEVTVRLHHHFLHHDITDIRSTVENAYAMHTKKKVSCPLNKHQQVSIRLREFLQRRYDIRYNEVMQMTEFRERHSFRFMYRELDRRELNNIFHEAQLEGIAPTFGEVDTMVHSTMVPKYNPIEDYFNNLPEWDGRDRMTELAEMVPTDNPHWQRLFKQWFLSMVAHWMNGDEKHANSTAPILIGAQGYRKSTFCRQLLPPELQMFYTDSVDFTTNTAAERLLSRFLIINIDEFDQLSEKQFAYVKHLFQKPVTNIRRMYSETIGSQRRYASFIGTTNSDEILRDPTGNRRYICVNVTAPIKTEQPVDYQQLYAQAVNLITHGTRYWLNDEDERLIKETNVQFEVQSALEEHFLTCFAPADNEMEGTWMRSTEILEALFALPTFNKKKDNNPCRLGYILTKHKVRKSRTGQGYVYLVKRVKE